MSTNWREFATKKAPPWLQSLVGERFIGAAVLFLDAISQGFQDALRAPWVLDPTSPPDALPLIGNERGMPRYPPDMDETHRTRLAEAWDRYEVAGTAASIIAELEAFGLTGIEIKTARDWDWDSLAPGPATWAEGVGGADNWSRFWVIIHGHPWAIEGTWADPGVWDDDGVWDLNATPEDIQTVRAIIQKWKSAESLNPWIIVVLDDVTWAAEQPDGTWYDCRNRSNAAVYIDGKGQHPVLLP